MNKQKKNTGVPKTQTGSMTMPGALAALTVLVVFVVLGIFLANRSIGKEATQQRQLATNATLAPHEGEKVVPTALDHGQTPVPTPTAPHEGEKVVPTALDHGQTPVPMPTAPHEGEKVVPTALDHGQTPISTVGVPPQQPVAEEGQRKTYTSLPPMTIDPQKTYKATITTPRGDIVIKLRPDIAPQTVNSFVFLAREGFYNGLTWHRVLPNFMAQGGDPTGTGMGGPGYSVPAEFTDKILFDRPGILAMARSSDPNSGGSQFFITNAPAPWLNNQYTPFGEVIEGQEIVNAIPLRNPETATEPGEKMLKITISEEG